MENSLLQIQIEEVTRGLTLQSSEEKLARTIMFNISNPFGNFYVAQKIYLDIVGITKYELAANIPYSVEPCPHRFKHRITLNPFRLGQIDINRRLMYKYKTGEVDEFAVICRSSPGWEYMARITVYHYPFAREVKYLPLMSDIFRIAYPKEG